DPRGGRLHPRHSGSRHPLLLRRGLGPGAATASAAEHADRGDARRAGARGGTEDPRARRACERGHQGRDPRDPPARGHLLWDPGRRRRLPRRPGGLRRARARRADARPDATMSGGRAVGFVGLGRVGWAVARHLARAGFAVPVRAADPERQQLFASELDVKAVDDPAGFGSVEAVITMLPTGRDVRGLMLDWEGGLGAALAPGTVLVDMSSSDPPGTRELGAALAEHGVGLVDAPVSGGVPKAEAGTLAIMIGGDDDSAIDRARPYLEALGERFFRTGPLGSGHAMKALNNYVAAAAYTASAEALLVGARFGLDPATVVQVLNASPGRSFNTEANFVTQVLPRRFASGFTLGLMTKDVGIAADLAEAMEIDAPLCRLTSRLWQDAVEDEGPAADHTAAIRHWEKTNGLELPRR